MLQDLLKEKEDNWHPSLIEFKDEKQNSLNAIAIDANYLNRLAPLSNTSKTFNAEEIGIKYLLTMIKYLPRIKYTGSIAC